MQAKLAPSTPIKSKVKNQREREREREKIQKKEGENQEEKEEGGKTLRRKKHIEIFDSLVFTPSICF